MLCASYNIQYAKGKDGRYDLDRIVAELGDADLIALQEVETHVERSGDLDQARELSERMPHMYWSYGPGIDADVSVVQNGRVINKRRQFGNMILSRWPLLSVTNHPLPKVALHGLVHSRRAMVEAVIDTPMGALRCASVHFDHIGPSTRLPQIALAKEILLDGPRAGASWGGPFDDGWFERPEPPMPAPVILMGDCNFAPDSAEYDVMVGGKSRLFGRVREAHGFADAWVAAGHAEDEGPTIFFDTYAERIDYCFVTRDLAARVSKAWVDTGAQGSDHQPVFFEFST
ncbi:endonuclease/exonuclease/phosphatase family protein [Mameliella sp.]|uniref:endonuclease/exonuclease/phosphatase family protein n=1 Tax=Mameliella sp. TaxID=1924940 RepID=UPI003B50A1BD